MSENNPSPRPLHILLIHQAFAWLDEAGGTRHAEIARYLAQNGFKITIIASPVSYLTGKKKDNRRGLVIKESPVPGVTILRTIALSPLHGSFWQKVINFISFMVSSFLAGCLVAQVDIVWGTSPPIFQSITAWFLARLKRAKFLFEVRDLWPAFAIDMGILKNKTLITASLFLEKFLYIQSDRILINSPGFYDHISARGGKKISVIPNGSDSHMFDPGLEGRPQRDRLGLTDEYLVMYAGAHGPANDLHTTIKAAEILKDQPQIKIVLVGDGKEKAALMVSAAEKQLKNVIFLPPVAKMDMPGLLAAADACLAILKPIEMYKTTYPNKVFDYMAAGRPVILCIDGVIRRVVEEAQAGLFVQPGDAALLADAILKMSKNRLEWSEKGISGRRYLQQYFDRDDLSRKMASLLWELKND